MVQFRALIFELVVRLRAQVNGVHCSRPQTSSLRRAFFTRLHSVGVAAIRGGGRARLLCSLQQHVAEHYAPRLWDRCRASTKVVFVDVMAAPRAPRAPRPVPRNLP